VLYDTPPTVAAGRVCHRCGAPAELQAQRHATEAEYGALSENFLPIDGRATVAVYSCGNHDLPAFCEHTDTAPQPCPDCHANPGQPCTKPDGSARLVEHAARRDAQPQPDVCRHAHREDCGGHGACVCTADDSEPVRPRRPAGPLPGPVMTHLTIPVHVAQMLLAQAGVPWTRVREVRTGYTQENQLALFADVFQYGPDGVQLTDPHGAPITESVTVPLPDR
jgi:hypothetical protein